MTTSAPGIAARYAGLDQIAKRRLALSRHAADRRRDRDADWHRLLRDRGPDARFDGLSIPGSGFDGRRLRSRAVTREALAPPDRSVSRLIHARAQVARGAKLRRSTTRFRRAASTMTSMRPNALPAE